MTFFENFSRFSCRIQKNVVNGNTADSGPAFPGSSPGIPTRTLNEKSSSVFLCPHFKCTRYYIYLETTNLFPNLT